MDRQHPTRIDKYEILGVLGEGGMGIVYRGLDKRMGREVAIKTVTEDFVRDATMLERFYQEAEKTGRLKHPNIVTVYDLGEQGGCPYIVMELVDGRPLDKIIRDDRNMPLLEKLRIVEQVASALGFAHRHDVIHRDVKPANVIVQRDGTAKLLDFGIARDENRQGQGLTRTGIVVGTVPYMAPERLRGATLDARSDIFAIGVVLFQTLTGQLPWQGEDALLAGKIFNEKHPKLSLYLSGYPPVLDSILDRALAKSPDDRYPTADEMATELFALVDQLKRQHIGEVIIQVQKLSTDQQYVEARDTLLQVLKLDNQHPDARRLLAEVQQHLSKKQREEQAQNLCTRAEDLAREKDFKKAIDLLDQATKLVPDDKQVFELLEQTRHKKTVHEQIEEFLRQADAARNSGDIDSARAIVEKARDLDAHDSRVQGVYISLSRHEEEAEDRLKAKKLMEEAQEELNRRQYPAAVKLLREAVDKDPLNQQLAGMLASAIAREQQEQRRNTLDEVANEVAQAISYEQIKTAQTNINAAIKKIGADPVLLRLQAQVVKQLRQFEAKRLVEDTVRDARAVLDTNPKQALELVESVLERLPTNEHLLALRAEISDRLVSAEREAQQSKVLEQAHKAVSESRFSDAVAALESCDPKLLSKEMSELLEFARNEARGEEHRQLVASAINRGQQMIREGRYQEATAFLKPIVAEQEDPAVQTLFKQAESLQSAVLEKANAAAAQVRALLQVEAFEQALASLEDLPADVQLQATIQSAIDEARKGIEREHQILAILAESYALLAAGKPAPVSLRNLAQTPPRGVIGQMVVALESRRTTTRPH